MWVSFGGSEGPFFIDEEYDSLLVISLKGSQGGFEGCPIDVIKLCPGPAILVL